MRLYRTCNYNGQGYDNDGNSVAATVAAIVITNSLLSSGVQP